jgi:putative Mg2+ transporter-C (MgtC) family protein
MPLDVEIVLRLLLAAVLGSLIGIDRERLAWAAGLRTHMLVCVGATLIMIVSAYGFNDVLTHPNTVLDPSRVAAQVVSGIGFLGAGTILLRHEVIRGLTTAGSLWAVAAVGLAVGGGLYVTAISATVLILLILAGLKPIEQRLRKYLRIGSHLELVVQRDGLDLAAITQAIDGVGVVQITVTDGPDAATEHVEVALDPATQRRVMGVVTRLRQLKGVDSVRMMTVKADAST